MFQTDPGASVAAEHVKIGVLLGSLVSGLVGGGLLAMRSRAARAAGAQPA